MESEGVLSKKWFIWTLFIFLFGYAAIRAWTVVPILDELATFYSYIRTGHYFNTIELVDANNHVLNSFFGHQFYRLFGDHFFLFRLPSLLAFPIYFFSAKYIAQTSLPKSFNTIVFISLVSIPWVFEYFSYSRGYGMAIAFFLAAIALLIKWKTSNHWKHFSVMLLCLLVAVASSLTYLFPSLLLFLCALLILILNRKHHQRKVLSIAFILVWMAALVPFILYSFELKDAGALWWGNQDGLWESTGKSLSRLVLFSDAPWIFYFVLSLMVFGTVSFFISWIKSGFWSYLKETEAMIFILLIGNITGIVVMRYLFDVNFPMDRVGMYLVPLFILFLGAFLSKYNASKYALVGLILIPISFLLHFNISTSIFSPEDRIPTYLSDQIKTKLSDESALSAEYVSHMSYAYSCRKDKKVHIAFTADKAEQNLGDYHINWLGREPINSYDVVYQDSESHTRFYKRSQPQKRTLIVDTIIQKVNTSEMYFTLFTREIDSILTSKPLQVAISSKMKFDQFPDGFNVIQTITDDMGAVSASSSPMFGWYFGDRKDANFTFVDRVFELKPTDKEFQVFLLNAQLRTIEIGFFRLRIYQIDQ